jgi:hypothetical protein
MKLLKLYDRRHPFRGPFSKCCLALALAFASFVSVATAQQTKEDSKKLEVRTPTAGLTVSGEATAKDVGLPVYPGARLHKDAPSEDTTQANLAFWTSKVGFKLVVVKYESEDAVEKVSAFYRKALGQYGHVLQCTAADEKKPEKHEHSKDLDCGDDKPEKGGIELKAGTRERQHIVGVEPRGTGSKFELVYLESHGLDDDSK